MVDSHKQLLSSLGNWMEQDATLLTMTNDVDYDQDGECFFVSSFSILSSL